MKAIGGILFAVVLIVSLADLVSAQDWFDPNWQFRREVTITENSGNALSDYQVSIGLNPSNFDYSKANADGSDIRFTDINNNLLSYFIENWNPAGSSEVLVKVPNILASSAVTILMYYGNPSALSLSNPHETFIFYDDFEYIDDPTNHGWKLNSGAHKINYQTSTDFSFQSSRSLKLFPLIREIVFLERNLPLDNKYKIEVVYYETDSFENTIYTGLKVDGISGISGNSIDFSPWVHDDPNYKGVANRITYVSSIPRIGGWHTYVNQRDGTNVKSFVDDVEITQASYTSSEIISSAGLWSGSTDSNGGSGWDSVRYYDLFKIMKFVDPEPSFSIGTEENQIVLIPTLISPKNGTIVVSGVPIKFDWTDIEGAEGYFFTIRREDGLTLTLSKNTTKSELTAPSKFVKKAPNGKYFWKVAAIINGKQQPFSEEWMLTRI